MVEGARFQGKESLRFKPNKTITIAAVGAIVVGGAGIYVVRQAQVPKTETVPVTVPAVPEIKTVTSLGRLEPRGEVIKLSAPTSAGQGSRVERLLVKEGDPIKPGQVIAILDNRDRLQAAWMEAQEAIRVAQANLAKVQAGAKTGEIEAQKSEISRIQAQGLGDERAQREALARLEAQWQGEKAAQQANLARLEAQLQGDLAAQQAAIKRLEVEQKNALAEFNRYQKLYSDGAISESLYDSKRLAYDTVSQQLNEAKTILGRTNATGTKQITEARTNLQRITATGSKQINEAQAVLARIQDTSNQQVNAARATLDKIAEVRPVDVASAKVEINRAIAVEQQAKANLEQAYVKAPQDGVVFKINTRPGETVSNDGIIEIGQVNQMMAVLEVYQSDVGKVRPGQKVKISSDTLTDELQGTVDWVGWQVQRQNAINTDPSENIDSRVVEVHVKLDGVSSQKAAKFTNLQVKGTIEI